MENPSGLEINKRLIVGPYGLKNDCGDKFVSSLDTYIDESDRSKLVVVIDLLDSEATVKVRPSRVDVDGQKKCSGISKMVTSSRLCGKFVRVIRPPKGYYFEKDKITLNDESCKKGVCTFKLTIEDDGEAYKYDL